MLIESQVGELGFVHTGETLWEIINICTSSLPDRNGRLVHQNVSELLGGACKMQNVKGSEMSKYLKALVRNCTAQDGGQKRTSNKTSIGSSMRPSNLPALPFPFARFFACALTAVLVASDFCFFLGLFDPFAALLEAAIDDTGSAPIVLSRFYGRCVGSG